MQHRCLSSAFSQRYHHLLLLAVLIGVLSMTIGAMAQINCPKDQAMQVSATVQAVPPQITLCWPDDHEYGQAYTIWRKAVDAKSWGTPLAVLPASARQYADRNVQIGILYEYKVGKQVGPNRNSFGYLRSGIEVPLVEHRGTVILLVDTDSAALMPDELAQLERDLVGDGWGIIRHDVRPTAQPATIRRLLQNDYFTNPGEVRSLFIFGKVPIQKSGCISPDGHAPRPFPCDAYYANLDGIWTDTETMTDSDTGERQLVPGDGKLDQGYIASPVQLECGRVYLGNLPAFKETGKGFEPKDENALLRQYLHKDHNFRVGIVNPPRRVLFDDSWWRNGNAPHLVDTWRGMAPLVGADNIFEKRWRAELPKNGYLWAVGGGGGSYERAWDVTYTADIAVDDPKAVFTMLFGSYFCEWDRADDLLCANLASTTMGLTSSWAAWPFRLVFPMAMGETIGYANKLTQNEDGSFYGAGDYYQIAAPLIAVALMGDPTLHMHIVPPPGALTAVGHGTAVDLAWSASPDAGVCGYHVYRAATPYGPFTRLNGELLTGTTCRDAAPLSGQNVYLVRAVKLETGASGSYYNASQGVFATLTLPAAAAQPDLLVRNPGDTYACGEHLYRDDARQTKGQVAVLNTPATYELTVRNDGTATDTVKVTALAAGPGWAVHYYDAPTGGNEISLTGAGWSQTLAAGAAKVFRAEVTQTAAQAAALTLPVTATSMANPARTDRVLIRPILNLTDQPDLSVRLDTEATEVGKGIINTTGEQQQLTSTVTAGTTKSFLVTVTNTSDKPAAFLVRLRMSVYDTNWRAGFTDTASGKEVSGGYYSAGWRVVLAPGASHAWRYDAHAQLPQTGHPSNAGHPVTITFVATSEGLVEYRSDALAITTSITDPPPPPAPVSVYQPDVKIAVAARGSTYDYFGNCNDVYNDDAKQTMRTMMEAGQSRTLYLSVENDNPVKADTITVTATPGNAQWSVQYFDDNTKGNDITAQITSPAGWVLPNLGPKAYHDLRIVLTANANAPRDMPIDFVISAVSQTEPAKTDRVIAHAICSDMTKADAMIRLPGEPTYFGENLFETMVKTQTKGQSVLSNETAIFEVREKNISTATTAFGLKLFGPGAPTGWAFHIYAAKSGEEITRAVLDGQWVTPTKLAPGESFDYRVEFTPDDTVANGAIVDVMFMALPIDRPICMPDTFKLSVGRAQNPEYYPDLQIRTPGADYIGKETLLLKRETVQQSVRPGKSLTYGVCVRNNGSREDKITITGAASGNGWTYQYFDDPVAGSDITAQITGGGWTVANLAPGAAREFRVVVTPGKALVPGATGTLQVTATSTSAATRRDTVAAVTTLLNGVQPDAMLRPGSDAKFTGAGIYNTLAKETVVLKAAAGKKAVYLLQLKNTGDEAGPLKLTGDAGGKGWTVRYYNAATNGSDITAQLTGPGYTTGTFPPGATGIIRLEVTPDAGTKSAVLPITIHATAVADPGHTDVVQAVTRVGDAR